MMRNVQLNLQQASSSRGTFALHSPSITDVGGSASRVKMRGGDKSFDARGILAPRLTFQAAAGIDCVRLDHPDRLRHIVGREPPGKKEFWDHVTRPARQPP